MSRRGRGVYLAHRKEKREMTVAIFLILLYQTPQETVIVFEQVQEPADYTFIWLLGILAVILFIGFFWWIRRQNRA
jgi:hypothetical protein